MKLGAPSCSAGARRCASPRCAARTRAPTAAEPAAGRERRADTSPCSCWVTWSPSPVPSDGDPGVGCGGLGEVPCSRLARGRAVPWAASRMRFWELGILDQRGDARRVAKPGCPSYPCSHLLCPQCPRACPGPGGLTTSPCRRAPRCCWSVGAGGCPHPGCAG